MSKIAKKPISASVAVAKPAYGERAQQLWQSVQQQLEKKWNEEKQQPQALLSYDDMEQNLKTILQNMKISDVAFKEYLLAHVNTFTKPIYEAYRKLQPVVLNPALVSHQNYHTHSTRLQNQIPILHNNWHQLLLPSNHPPCIDRTYWSALLNNRKDIDILTLSLSLSHTVPNDMQCSIILYCMDASISRSNTLSPHSLHSIINLLSNRWLCTNPTTTQTHQFSFRLAKLFLAILLSADVNEGQIITYGESLRWIGRKSSQFSVNTELIFLTLLTKQIAETKSLLQIELISKIIEFIVPHCLKSLSPSTSGWYEFECIRFGLLFYEVSQLPSSSMVLKNLINSYLLSSLVFNIPRSLCLALFSNRQNIGLTLHDLVNLDISHLRSYLQSILKLDETEPLFDSLEVSDKPQDAIIRNIGANNLQIDDANDLQNCDVEEVAISVSINNLVNKLQPAMQKNDELDRNIVDEMRALGSVIESEDVIKKKNVVHNSKRVKQKK